MKKKLLSVVLCGVMAAALLAGCGKKIDKDRAANNKNFKFVSIRRVFR